MRMMNLDPFWRTSVGFDRLFDLMDESLRYDPEDHYPPCNIVRTGEDKYRISLAVAGFKVAGRAPIFVVLIRPVGDSRAETITSLVRASLVFLLCAIFGATKIRALVNFVMIRPPSNDDLICP